MRLNTIGLIVQNHVTTSTARAPGNALHGASIEHAICEQTVAFMSLSLLGTALLNVFCPGAESIVPLSRVAL